MEENKELIEERYELVLERIKEIPNEELGHAELEEYFSTTAKFLLVLNDTKEFLEKGGLDTASFEELQKRNHMLYQDVLPEHYDTCFGNPVYAVRKLGREYGQYLGALYYFLYLLIEDVYEMRIENVTAGMELFAEVYTAFSYGASEGILPKKEDIKEMVYWYFSDYADLWGEQTVKGLVCVEDCRAAEIVKNSDLNDVRYLFRYGYYVTENEIETAKYLAKLPQETIATMADTFTEGYRIGFEVTGKDLSKKCSGEIRYKLGFERMIRKAIENFEKMNLGVTISWTSVTGGTVNRQFEYDHKDDLALILDKNYITRRVEGRKAGFEKYKKEALGFAGPAVVETFGEADFNPENKSEAVQFTDEQNKLYVELLTKMGALTREYIIPEERSFTIIAFPIPEVGPVFEELFHETIKLNTLDYILYRDVQQKLIDELDQADYCEVKGCGANKTDLKINLWKLKNPEKETIFENCVADVNIPVGEVFTSPVLEGTEGVLHVTKVYLNGLEYRNLKLNFKDGMITDYNCSNFNTEEENRNFVKENILFRHETLPIGEFAIGTNTTAYVMSRRLNVEAKLPILIAEKTGPHFAVGDTCYSHTEDMQVYNPDGKEIMAKDNSKSMLRLEDPAKAYYNCHTDITIPYDELGELTAVHKDGIRVKLIENGRFVLPGTEVLNEAFDN